MSETYIPDNFEERFGDKLRAWCAVTFPQVDFDATMIQFREKAESSGTKTWKARRWDSKFKCIVRTALARHYDGVVVVKRDRDHDPRWSIIHVARKEGFRDPELCETPHSYETALRQWRTQPRSNVVDFAKAVRRV